MQKRTNPREGARDEVALGLPHLDDLTGCHSTDQGWVVDMPLITLGGNAVRITVLPAGDGFTVTDDGRALADAEGAGVCATDFRLAASAKAATYGVTIDEGALVFPMVRPDQVRGAVITLANAIKEILDKLADSVAAAA
ncbi:MAG: hypothetical protein ABNH26_08580 [Celeribacter sp.]|jgi:hypothetical protein